MKTPRSWTRHLMAASLLAAASCTTPSPLEPEPKENPDLERRVAQLESRAGELTERNERLEELLAAQKDEQRRLQAAIGTLRSELQHEIDRRLAAEKREAVVKERFLSARLEAIELQTKLYELQMEDAKSASAASDK